MNLMFWRRDRQDPAPTPEERREELLSAYLDGAVTGAERAQVEALLERDPDADAYLDDLRLMRNAFGALGEVRAPRSFAIPAPAAGSGAPSSPMAMFQRVEWMFRASAAAAALLFVVVLVGDQGADTPVAAPAMQMAAERSAGTESLMPADTSRTGPAPALALPPGVAPDAAPAPEPEGTPAPGEVMGAMALPADDDEAPDEEMSALASPDLAGDDEAPTQPEAAFEPMPVPSDFTGTELVAPASDRVGGLTHALATLAALLTAISVLLAWERRTSGSGRSDQR